MRALAEDRRSGPNTERQARALESELRGQGIDAHCFVAMRYWHPFTSEAIEQLRAADAMKLCFCRCIRNIRRLRQDQA